MTEIFQQRLERVEAAKLTKDNADQLAQWVGGLRVDIPSEEGDVTVVSIQVESLGELVTAMEGDYIVRHPTGRIYTGSSETFESMYEPIGPGTIQTPVGPINPPGLQTNKPGKPKS